jgi:hypothetical protein
MADRSVPAIPQVPTTVDAATRLWMEKVKEALEVRLGQRGDDLDMAVTRRDLVDNGIARVYTKGSYLTVRTLPPNPTFVPIGAEADPYGDESVPLYPVGVEVHSSSNYNLITWSPPGEIHVERAEVWRTYDSQTLDDAVLLGTGQQAYADAVGGYQSALLFHYFVRFVSYKGKESAWHSLTGTDATPHDLTDEALKVLTADKVLGASGIFMDLVAENGSISNAMIGNTIQSDNYVLGVAGWIIKK